MLRLNYLHRDSGNYKVFGSKDYANPSGLSLGKAEELLRKHLIDGAYFYPEQARILKFDFHRNRYDHSWYEFESLESIEVTNVDDSFDELINYLSEDHLLSPPKYDV